MQIKDNIRGDNAMDLIEIKSSLYDYTVEFVPDFLEVLKKYQDFVTYIIDRNVYELYKEKFAYINKENVFFMEATEKEKCMETVIKIMSFWQKIGVRKNWKVICFGGGITQDVTTIASNLFLRNIEWYFFPTTLLAMSDSCIGGKCGINFNSYKNQIGVFYPPKKIYIDVNFINTLTTDDYLNGWGEILKFSLTSDSSFFEKLKNEKSYIPCDNIEYYIHQGLFVKKLIIEEDEFEHDLRRVLNYGHTFGHALEAYTNNEIPHGKGVIWGLDIANYISFRKKLITKEYYLEIKKLIKEFFLKEEICIDNPDKMYEIIKTDKKVKGDNVYLALLDGNSHLAIYPMAINGVLKEYFKNYLEETHEYYCN